ncbi:hypothetical protein RsS62_57010 [Rhizobium dioscoreae]|nr:hypothetical protein RsS62_57010 [Rhizobium dioscoreae]
MDRWFDSSQALIACGKLTPRMLIHHFADGRVSILEAAVTRVPKIIIVENAECEIILTKLQNR